MIVTLIIMHRKYTKRPFTILSFLLKKGTYFKNHYKYNYKVYRTPIAVFLKFYVLYQSDYEPLNPAEIFKLNNLMYLNFDMLWLFDKNILKFLF